MVKDNGQYIMVFRNDYGFDEQTKKAPLFQLGLAFSSDGVEWTVEPHPILEKDEAGEVMGSYDPHLMVMDGRYYITYAQYTKHGYRGTTVVTDDFKNFHFLDRTVPDNRDIVIFPEKINGRYLRQTGNRPSRFDGEPG